MTVASQRGRVKGTGWPFEEGWAAGGGGGDRVMLKSLGYARNNVVEKESERGGRADGRANVQTDRRTRADRRDARVQRHTAISSREV